MTKVIVDKGRDGLIQHSNCNLITSPRGPESITSDHSFEKDHCIVLLYITRKYNSDWDMLDQSNTILVGS